MVVDEVVGGGITLFGLTINQLPVLDRNLQKVSTATLFKTEKFFFVSQDSHVVIICIVHAPFSVPCTPAKKPVVIYILWLALFNINITTTFCSRNIFYVFVNLQLFIRRFHSVLLMFSIVLGTL